MPKNNKPKNPVLFPASMDDLNIIEEGLKAENLPLEPWEECDAGFYMMVTPEGEKIGFGGLEVLGKTGLLRSMVVNKDKRGEGLGQMLTLLMITRAHLMGLKKLYLLTYDQQDFFAKMGFKEIPRDEAPDEIKATSQFSGLCDETAKLMGLSLGEG